jgi:hypothetical protein
MEVNIRDAQTRLPVPVAGIESENGKFLQSAVMTYSPLEYTVVADAVSSEEWYSLAVNVERKSIVIMRCSFSDSGANAVIRFVLYDQPGLALPSATFTVTASDLQQDGRYLAPMQTFNAYGAVQVKIYIDSISAGDVTIHLAAV